MNKNIFPLTKVQQAYYIGKTADMGNGGFSTHVYYEFETVFKPVEFNKALNKVIYLQPMLRTIFLSAEEQLTLDSVPEYSVPVYDFRNQSNKKFNSILTEIRGRLSHKIYDASQFPLFTFEAVLLPNDITYLFCSCDMLIADGLSLMILMNEIARIYKAGENEENLKVQFKDYVNEISNNKLSIAYQKSKEHWMKRLEDFPSAPCIPEKSDCSFADNTTERKQFYIKHEDWLCIKSLLMNKNISPTEFFLTAYARVMAYWSGQEKITINMPVSGRPYRREGMNRVIGDFTKIILVPISFESDDVWESVMNVKKSLMIAYKYSAFDGLDIMRELSKENGGAKVLMPIVFTSLLFSEKTLSDFEGIGKIKFGASQTPQVNLDCQIFEYEKELIVTWDFISKKYNNVKISRMFNQFNGIIKSVLKGKPSFNCLTPGKEDRNLIRLFNDTHSDICEGTLVAMLKESFKNYERQIAVQDKNNTISYGELNRLSGLVAEKLQSRGISAFDIVCVNTERNVYSVINIIGIIRIGAVYVPVDSDYPEERRKFIINNSNSKAYIDSDFVVNNPDKEIKTEVFYDSKPEDTAYIIYTSGSTGTPKGVEISHDAAYNTIISINRKWNINETDRILGVSSYGFDLSVYDIFGTFSAGATLIINKNIRDIDEIVYHIKKDKITIWNSVPALMQLVIEQIEKNSEIAVNSSLRLCLLSGDWIPVKLPGKIIDAFPSCRVISLGGATEASIWSIYHELSPIDADRLSIPYGKPLDNQTIYILDNSLKCVPIGVQGEIYIGGRGVAKGYFNDKDKSACSFVMHSQLGLVYKTGDYGRFNEEGEIEFLGRKDFQVKIGGHRIELSEIEAVSNNYKGIINSVANVEKNRNNKKILKLYYVAEEEINSMELTDFLGKYLPYYMMPTDFIKIEKVPLTDNGKVNKIALCNMSKENEVQILRPVTKLEKELYKIWKENLNLTDFSIDEKFLSLGGDSISMVHLLAKIKKKYGIEIPFQKFLQHSSLIEVADFLGNIEKNTDKDTDENKFYIDFDNRYEIFNLSELQESYFVGRQNEKEYNGLITNGYVEIECSNYNHEKMEKVINTIINRHDMLRVCIYKDGTQQINKQIPDYRLPLVDICSLDKNQKNEYILNSRNIMINQKLDLEKPPLLSAFAIKINNNTAILQIYVDGMIVDGWSYEVFHRELEILYRDDSIELPELNMSYRDYIRYKKFQKTTKKYAEDKKYWMEKINRLPEPATLPLLSELKDIKDIMGLQIKCGVSMEVWNKLILMARKKGISPFIVLFTSFALVIGRWNYRKNILLNIPEYDRPGFHKDINQIIGICSSFLLFSFNYEISDSFMDLVFKNQKELWELKSHNYFSGMEVIREICRRNNRYDNVLIPIVFGMMAEVEQAEKELLKVVYQENHTSQIWIDINTVVYNNCIEFNWNCVKGLMDENMLKEMVKLQQEILEKAAESEEFWSGKIDLPLPEAEKELISLSNSTDMNFKFYGLSQMMFQSFEKNADNICIASEDIQLTYTQVKQQIFNYVKKLKSAGCRQNDFVAICLPKGIQQILNILAVSYSGAVYVPIEYNYPVKVMEKCIDNLGCRIVIMDNNINQKLSQCNNYNKIIVEYDEVNIKIEEDNISPVQADKEALVCIIYTSGSTGIPKAVPIKQIGLQNAIDFTIEKFNISQCDKAIALTNYAHDMSLFDIFAMIRAGGSIIVPSENMVKDPCTWGYLITKYKVTIWNSVPAWMEMFFGLNNINYEDILKSIRLVIHGGDYLPIGLAEKIKKANKNIVLVNVGGPTETTLWNIYHVVRQKDIEAGVIPYGQPIYNTKYYLLNENMQQVPVGVIGMMYCSGIGVTEGYINNKKETAKRYIRWNKTNELIYKTGDLGKYDLEGRIIFQGREDFQIKINGKRIELNGISSIFRLLPGIINCVTVLGNQNDLVTYYVSSSEIQKEAIFIFMKERLPDYMIPKHYIRLDKMPLTYNGKIDRKMLPPIGNCLDKEKKYSLEPVDELEHKILKIYQDVLGAEADINTDFFKMGGDSLMAVKLVNRLREELEIEISLTEMFGVTTIHEVYEIIKINIKGKEKIQ